MASVDETIYQFVVPDRLKPLLEAGKLIRRGALLIDPSGPGSGIVAHLQETSAFARIAASAWNPISVGLQAVDLATGAVNVVQNEQIKRRIDVMQLALGTMQNLQIAGLIGSVASIGVSAAGTMLILERIETLKKGMQRIEGEIHAFRDEWRMADLLGLLDRATTHVRRVDNAKQSADSAAILRNAEQALHEVFVALSRRGRDLTERREIAVIALRTIVDGMVVAGDARTKALFLLDDGRLAASFARERMGEHMSMARRAPRDLLVRRLRDVEDAPLVAAALSSSIDEVRYRIASVPPLLASLNAHSVKPSEFLAASEAETDAPLMFLPPVKS